MRSIITPDELVLRMAEIRPKVLVVDGIEKGRIICETATEHEFGPRMRRMSIYAMSPETYNRAYDEVRTRWGERPDWSVNGVRVSGKALRIPLSGAGVSEWEIQL